MPVFRNPLERHTFLPMNRNAGDFGKEVIIENAVSQRRQIRDLELPSQLTQLPGRHGFVPRTRENAYRNVTLVNPQIVGRMEKSKTQYQKSKYFEPRI